MQVNHRYLVKKNSSSQAPLEEWHVLEESQKAFKIQTLHYKGAQTFWELKSFIEADYTVVEDLGPYVAFGIGFPETPVTTPGFPSPLPGFHTGTPPPGMQPTTTSGGGVHYPQLQNKLCKCGGNCACKKGQAKNDGVEW